MRPERMVYDHEIIKAMLKRCEVCTVGFMDKEVPYVVPMNYGFSADDEGVHFYMHTLKEGYKNVLIAHNDRVCVSVYEWLNFPDRPYRHHLHDFNSVMAFGHIRIIKPGENNEDFGRAMQMLFKNTNRTGCGNPASIPKLVMLEITCLWKDISGKTERPLNGPEDVPIPNPYLLPEDDTPYDFSRQKAENPKEYLNTDWLGYYDEYKNNKG